MFKLKLLATFLPSFLIAAAPEKQDVASVIIKMERAALDRSDKGDTDGFLEISDPDVVYFDPFLDEPIHGLKELTAYYHKNSGDDPGRGEMLRTRVTVAGDMAVLTFNYVSTKPGSGSTRCWNATEVYRRSQGVWRIIHTHWSLTKPVLASPAP